MSLLVPKTKYSRLQLPHGVASGTPAGLEEPANAEPGTLSYDPETEKVRVYKESAGWSNVGSIDEIVAGEGIVVTDGTGPVVTVAVDTDPADAPFVLKDLDGSYTEDVSPELDDWLYMQDGDDGEPRKVKVQNLSMYVRDDFSVYTPASPGVNSDFVFNVSGSPGAVRTANLGDIQIQGDVSGSLSDVTVEAVTETSGPTSLTIGSVPDGTFARRVGSTLVGEAAVREDVASYPVKGLPVGADLLYIADSADSDQIKITDVQGILDAITPPTWLPYLAPPASPNSFNDEFLNGGSADLATRGWTFRRFTSVAGTMTRVGDIYPNRGIGSFTPLGTYEYRSSIVGNRLLLQLPFSGTGIVGYTITKSVSVPTTSTTHGAILWGRLSATTSTLSSGSEYIAYVNLCLCKDTGGFADLANRVLVGTYTAGTPGNNTRRANYTIGGTETNVENTITGGLMSTRDDIFVVGVQATTTNLTFRGDFANSLNGGYSLQYHIQPAMGVASLLTHAGVGLDMGNTDKTRYNFMPYDFALDFLRLYTGDLSGQWIGNQ